MKFSLADSLLSIILSKKVASLTDLRSKPEEIALSEGEYFFPVVTVLIALPTFLFIVEKPFYFFAPFAFTATLWIVSSAYIAWPSLLASSFHCA